MDIFDEEIFKFWKALQANEVRYIMIGGFASNLHGHQRFTGDMDLWLEDTRENRARLRQAFAECGMGDYPQLETLKFIPGWSPFRLNNGLSLDILTEMKGLDGLAFTDCFAMASTADIDGVIVPFLHINQLIANKKAINRPKDQIDVLELERIKQLRESE